VLHTHGNTAREWAEEVMLELAVSFAQNAMWVGIAELEMLMVTGGHGRFSICFHPAESIKDNRGTFPKGIINNKLIRI
jgi:hypothetical protein